MSISKKFDIDSVNNYIIISIVALLYFVAGKLSFMMSTEHQIVTIVIFASEGIALGAALYFGKKVIPAIFIGQLALAYSNGMDFMPSVEISIVNSLEALIGIYLFDKYRLNKELLTLRDIFGLIGIIVLVLQPFSAITGNTILLLNSVITSDLYLSSLFTWWFGNIMGQLLFTPFILILLANYHKIKLFEYFACSLIFTIAIYLLEIVFIIDKFSLLFAFTMPAIIFIVYRKGLAYGTLFTIILSTISSYSTYVDVGIFSMGNTIDNIININFFILAHILIILMVGILFGEVKSLNDVLEDKVKEEVEKNRQQQLLMLHQSRLAQMGEMISMIAHQWRQPLSSLSMLNTSMVLKYSIGTLDQEFMDKFADNTNTQIQNMSKTIDDFRDFFKPEKKKIEFGINSVIDDTMAIIRPVFAINDIEIIFDIKKDLRILGYPNELGQAILNILNNAKDALVDGEISDKYIKISLTENEEHIALSISDNAGGIPETIISSIFDPYFSTKDEKNGTGLGLYMTKIIIEDHMGGEIKADNLDSGAMFTISLLVL